MQVYACDSEDSRDFEGFFWKGAVGLKELHRSVQTYLALNGALTGFGTQM